MFDSAADIPSCADCAVHSMRVGDVMIVIRVGKILIIPNANYQVITFGYLMPPVAPMNITKKW